jgi:hypothetical protein
MGVSSEGPVREFGQPTDHLVFPSRGNSCFINISGPPTESVYKHRDANHELQLFATPDGYEQEELKPAIVNCPPPLRMRYARGEVISKVFSFLIILGV